MYRITCRSMYRIILCVTAAPLTLGIPASAGDVPVSEGDSFACANAKGDEAIAACSRVIKLGLAGMSAETLGFTLYLRGVAYENKGNHDRAIADLDQAIKYDLKNALFYVHRGEIHRKRGDNDRAIADAGQAIKLSPKNAAAYAIRGNAYIDRGEYDHAIDDLGEAIRLDPKSAGALINRGASYGNRGNYDLAIADFERAIKIDPKNASAYSNRGEVHQKMGNSVRAIADFDQAIKLDPRNAGAYRNRGIAYDGKGDRGRAIADFDQAIQLSDQAIKLDPKNAAAFINRGLAYDDKGDHDRAAADFNEAITLNPTLAAVRINRQRPQETAALSQTQVRPQIAPFSQVGSAPAAQAGSPPAAQERRVALVIGNSGYTSSLVSALPNPRRDAKVVADALRQAGFDTVDLVDLDRIGMAKALQSFRAKADNADWALVYFAGHGIEINRVNYLIPVDAKLAESGDVELETVSYDAMLNAIGGAKALRIIILDACRNNPFKASMRQTATLRGSLDRGLAAPPETKAGTLVVYSAKEGEAAVDGDGVNSPFALAFVARLKMPGREVQRMFDDVRDDVLEATNNHQQPYKYGSLTGKRDFFFVAGK